MTSQATRFPCLLALALPALLFVAGCSRDEDELALAPTPTPVASHLALTRSTIGPEPQGKPWVAHVQMCDLDQDGLQDVIVCEGQTNRVLWIHQNTRGHFSEITLAADIPGPVHTEAVDIDGDGDLDLLVASMGVIFPNNEKIGSVIVLENDGHQHFTKHVLLDHVARVTDVRACDFNRDGKLDLAVAQYGYDQGEVRWMENLGNWEFKSHILLNLSGAINVCIADFNGDRIPDFATVVAQQWEEVVLFENDGSGNFTNKIIFGSTNEDFGSSGLAVCDLNRDGRPDLIYTNGDGFDYAEPGARPWHGVQWLENMGGGQFRFHRIGDMAGAYSPVGVDLDRDGLMDVVAVSGFNDWSKPEALSMVWFRNLGNGRFASIPLAKTPTHLMCATAGDLDGNGIPVIITGGFHAYPPYENMSRVSAWRQK